MMHSITTKRLLKAGRIAVISVALVVIVALGFASKGGGGDRKNAHTEFTPIHSLSSFTLRSTPLYNSNYSFIRDQENNRVGVNTAITFQRGNTLFILPYKYSVSIGSASVMPSSKSNLQLIGVKIKIPK